MSKYLVLYRSPISPQEQMANSSPEQAQAGMDAWTDWANRAGSAVVDLGAPTADAGTVGRGTGGAAASGEAGFVGGFSILQADSTDAVKRLLESHPHLMLDGSSIELYEFLELPGQG